MASHLLFVDDSGTKEYAPSVELYGKNILRSFVFGGVLLPARTAGAITSEIVSLKIQAFGSPDVEIKSNWLRIPRETKRKYLDEFEVSKQEIDAFVQAHYDIVLKADLVLLAGVVDKVHMQEDYRNPWYAPAVAYEVLLQRVENELSGRGTVRVTVDDMAGATTPRRNQYKANPSRQHEQMRQRGSRLRQGNSYPFYCLLLSVVGFFILAAQATLEGRKRCLWPGQCSNPPRRNTGTRCRHPRPGCSHKER